jgi:hypothetical protein
VSENQGDWLRRGIEAGWCGPPCCATHDMLPSTDGEDRLAEDGDDPCLFVIRLYDDRAHRANIEANHPASIWRAANMGIQRIVEIAEGTWPLPKPHDCPLPPAREGWSWTCEQCSTAWRCTSSGWARY